MKGVWKVKQIIDLTMPIEEGMGQHPAHGRTPLFLSGTRNHEGDQEKEIINPYDDSDFTTFENEHIIVCGHTGTHMDSPYHFDPESDVTVEKIPVEYGFGPAIWLDVSHRFGVNVGITAKDLQEAEEKSGASIQPGDIVLIHTGWSTVKDTDKYSLESMGLTKDAAEWLREMKVKTVGLDSPNLDVPTDHSMPAHINFLRPRSLGLGTDDYITVIENVINIDQIPKARFLFSGAPIPYVGQTGGQLRALAYIED